MPIRRDQLNDLIDTADRLDYLKVIECFPWIIERDRKCILSTDSDGFLCGLAMTNVLDWRVVGFYDGKVLLVDKETDISTCTFLDIEINRNENPSIGNHLIQYDKNVSAKNFNFGNCIQPNIIRSFDGKNDFQRKYPFAAIHLILGILQQAALIPELNKTAMGPLIFVDGVGNNLFGYPENCLDWLHFLGIDKDKHILNPFLCKSSLSFFDMMNLLKDFFHVRDQYNARGYYNETIGAYQEGGRNKRTGHQLKISNGRGETINLVPAQKGSMDIHKTEKDRIVGFIKEMAKLMKWEYKESQWTWGRMKVKVLQKGMLSGESADPEKRLNNKTYQAMFAKNPFSLAMTASNRIEYTLGSSE